MRKLAALAALVFLFVPWSVSAGDDQVYKVGDGVTAPVPIERSEPAYTEAARDAHIEGRVVLSVVITSEGRVDNVKVARSLDPGLDQNAIEALKTWRFKPGEKDGQPVNVRATIEINFRLN